MICPRCDKDVPLHIKHDTDGREGCRWIDTRFMSHRDLRVKGRYSKTPGIAPGADSGPQGRP